MPERSCLNAVVLDDEEDLGRACHKLKHDLARISDQLVVGVPPQSELSGAASECADFKSRG